MSPSRAPAVQRRAIDRAVARRVQSLPHRGASSRAAISSAHPAKPSAVAPSQRLLLISLPIRDGRSAWSSGTFRALSACSAIDVL